MGPAQIRDKRPRIPYSWREGDLHDYTCGERLLGGHKGSGCHLTVSDKTTHRPFHQNPSWLKDAHAHMGGPQDIPNTDSEPGKAKWLAKENQEEMPHINDSNHHEGMTLSESALCVYPHVLYPFPPNKHFTCFISFHLCGNSLLQNWRVKALSLTTGLIVRIWCSHCHDLASISGQESKPLFKPLQLEATHDHFIYLYMYI